MSTASTPSSPMSHDLPCTKKRKVGVPKFLRYLYQILEKEDSTVIAWANGGSSIQILDTDRMAQYILPKYFKHSKYASFQRQLNYFGFRKWTKSQTNICTFSHPDFRQNRPDRLYLIKRKNSPETSRKKLPTVKSSSSTHTPMASISNNNNSAMHFRPSHTLMHLNALPDFLSATTLSGTTPSSYHRMFPSPTDFDKKDFKQQQQPYSMGDIENLHIQTDGPNFHLLDMNSIFAPTPLLPDMKDDLSTTSNQFDFDMNCAWLDNFNPTDSVTNAFGQPEYA
ncbi:hypothetical protein H310_03321 [Aphanomyces invadans]|uniref:HSF-type DNA-binding domain-containing protein n=1 Tax=Aphanomyces invadans TaxID=157072 RepID=A0A024UI81_9STRA|nr:hypothetical protein H310_03321 [Aphanomyces invadans]ETW05577.1 hypothetical protein H310_03321 [Aphanomyces invadans]RHY26103.1 hypothetical protein DYB32_007867 [Aphanomyces invadans]|eukprot:XP_008865354.1 hypothetical protein H310_03321 [Aphanomyces invadans]